ncbi:MAG: class I SAM-dependent methyltransferase [Planctomycetota bacterium]
MPSMESGERGPIGQQTMSPAMADMSAYPAYLLQQVDAAVGDKVWEIGVGNGQTSMALLARGCHVLATDIDLRCLQALELSVANAMPQVRHRLVTAQIDLNHPSTLDLLQSFGADSVVSFNVLEHIAEDGAALSAIARVAAEGATLGMVVPAMPALFGRMDSEAGHHRRYTRDALRKLLEGSGWTIRSCRYINALGALGWWFHNRLRRNAGLQDPGFNHQMRLSDRWLPRIARMTDPMLARRFGLSVSVVAQSRTAASKTD